jgi:F-type H+-transporting ATPase subunit delta
MLQNPVIKHDKKLEILRRIFQDKVNALTLAFLEIITRKNREPILAVIAREFHDAYNEYNDVGKASVITAVPLDKASRAELQSLAKKYSDKKQVELIEKLDSDLIGGFVLNIGDRQIDASIKNKIKTLKQKFSENPYIKEL